MYYISLIPHGIADTHFNLAITSINIKLMKRLYQYNIYVTRDCVHTCLGTAILYRAAANANTI
jgi:hypothetical protein